MAYVQQDDTLLDPNKQNQQGQAGGGLAGGATPSSGSGQDPFAGGSGVSTAGVGSGGQGGWTNIQSYLNANQGNTGSSDALSKQVGSQFDQEDQQFKDASSQARQQGQSEMDRSNLGQDQASKLVDQAAGLYSYKLNPQGATAGGQDPYQSIINQFQTAKQAYQGPQSFNYAPESYAKTQEYGQNLGSDQGFGALMQGVYSKAAGGPMNSGQQALQNQLDTNNPAVAQARQNLMNRYSGLSQGITQGTQDTNSFLQNAAGTVGQNQAALDQYLNQTGQQKKGTIDRSVGITNDAINGVASSLAGNVNSQRNYVKVDQPDPFHQINTYGAGAYGTFKDTPSQTATASNINGVTNERNGWNVIQDILNRPEQKIGQDQNFFDPTKTQFNWSNPSGPGSSGTLSLSDLQSGPEWQGLADKSALDYLTGQNPVLKGPSVGRQI